MDRLFSKMVDSDTPKFNRAVVDGLVCTYMEYSLEYIDRVIKTAMTHPDIEYLGYQLCTPKEEYNEITKNRSNRRTYDIAKSDIYLVKYMFAFKGEPLPPKYLYLPYVNDGGIIHLKGAKMHLNPVLCNKVISPSFNSLFVRLLRYKINFKRCYHAVYIDDIRQAGNVVWSDIYIRVASGKLPATTKANSTVIHYLLGKYGFNGVFEKYHGFIPVVGNDEINTKNYPKDKWVICRSTNFKPKTHIEPVHDGVDIRVAIPKDKFNDSVKTTLIGFYYVADHFPDRVKLDMLDSTYIWKILLGHILFSGSYGENKLFADIDEHYSTIDEYVDSIVREKLHESGCMVNDFYDLLAYINANFNAFIMNNESSSLNMYGKSLEVLYWTLYEVTSDIFRVSFKLNKPNLRSPMTHKNVIEIFNKNMRMRAIRSLTSNGIVIEAVGYCGDNKYFKITSKVTEQESMNISSGGKSRTSLGPDKHIHPSAIEAGNVLFLAKSDPTPCNKINPYIRLDLKTGTIVPNPKFEELRNELECKLKGVQTII